MTALWIILAIALVLTLLNLLPVGVDAAYAEGAFSLAARIGPARLHLLPKAPDAKPGKAKAKKPKKKKAKKKSAPPDAQMLFKLAELGLPGTRSSAAEAARAVAAAGICVRCARPV